MLKTYLIVHIDAFTHRVRSGYLAEFRDGAYVRKVACDQAKVGDTLPPEQIRSLLLAYPVKFEEV